MVRVRVALLLGFLLLAPVAGAQGIGVVSPASTPTTLYFHLLGPGDLPLNTQAPPMNHEADFTWGFAPTAPCLPETPVVYAGQTFATWYGYASLSRVDYDAEGSIRVHPERGVAYDVELDAAENFTVFWYLLVETPTAAGPVPLPAPNLQVLATMRAGDALGIDDDAYNSGALLAHGQTVPASILGDQVIGGGGQVRPVRQVGPAWVYEFAVPMRFDDGRIPRAAGFNMRIDVRIDNAGCEGAAPPLTLHSSAPARPRLEFNVLNPLRIEYLHPQFVEDDLVLHAALNSAWGNYDVPRANLTLAVRGPAGDEFVLQPQPQQVHVHGHPYQAASYAPTWVWSNATQASHGLYELQVTATNLQGTASITATAAFEFAPPNDAPFPPPIFLLLALLAALLARRRR